MAISFLTNYLPNHVYLMKGKYEAGVYFGTCYGLGVCKIKHVQNSKFQASTESELTKRGAYHKQLNDTLFIQEKNQTQVRLSDPSEIKYLQSLACYFSFCIINI